MASRPLLPYLWAANALPEDIGDADTYVPQNPEYPGNRPNQYTYGWEVVGTTDTKQPHQWINSWYQGVDYILTMVYSGELGWDAAIEYRPKATILHGNARWIAQSANSNEQPAVDSTVWLESEFGMKSSADAQLKLQQITATYDSHFNNRNNPHKVDWSNFVRGVGASTAQIDQLIADAAASINGHVADKNNPHGLTCAQVNVLEATVGGTFTGEVSMLRMLKGNGDAIRRAGNCFEMATATSSLGVRQGDACKDQQQLVTFGNYRGIKSRNSWKFTVPTPAIHLPLTSSINVYAASGPGIEYTSTGEIEYTNKSGAVATAAVNEPAFGALGLELRPDKGQALVIIGAYQGTTGTVSGVLDGTMLLADVLLDKSNVLEYFPAGTAIRDIRIWNQPLTAYQKAALGFH